MRPGFWHKCRVGFRWCRIFLWLVILAALCSVVFLNQVGLPDFLKTRLVSTLRQHGVELEFTRMRLRFTRGIVAENVRIGGDKPADPVLTLAEVQVKLDFRAFLERRVQVDGLYLREGRLVWRLSPTNRLRLDNIQAALRFQTNDIWSLDHFQADLAGASLALSGEIAHGPELRRRNVLRSSGTNNLAAWRNSLRALSDALDQIHFTGQPQLNLVFHGDARDLRSFSVSLNFGVPAVQSPWVQARDIQLTATATTPASVRAGSDAAWGIWTNLQPYQLEWLISARQVQTEKINVAALACNGSWHAPDLTVGNLFVELGGGRLNANGKLNVATRRLTFTNSASFELKALDALMPEPARNWLAKISWSQPPTWQVGGGLILPAWTNANPDWSGKVRPTVHLAGQAAITNVIAQNMVIDEVGTTFSYARRVWDFTDTSVALGKTRLAISGSVDDATENFYGHIRGRIDPESARPFLVESNAAEALELVKLAEPLALDLAVSGRGHDWESLDVSGSLAVTNFTVRDQHFDNLTTTVGYTNRVLEFANPLAHNKGRSAMADSVTLDFNAWLIYFTNILSTADPEPVVRAIGPKTWEEVEPYHFLSPPTARINGQIPLGDIHPGPEMDAVNMRFDIIKGAPFKWLRLATTNITGVLHWRGQTLLLTNVEAAFYGGSARGFADFDFRVSHEGGDYQFAVSVTNVDLQTLATGLSSTTNSLEGTLSGWLIVTNASTENLESWKGFGAARLQNGLIWDVPIFSIVSPVLNTVSPGLGNSRATEAEGKFRIANGVLSTDSLDIRSTMTRLKYVGTVDLEQNVNAHVTAQILRDTWVVGPLVSTALWPVSKIFEYHVTGKLENPKSEPIYVLPKLLLIPLHPIRTLENLFNPGGGSATNQPSVN